MVYMDTWPDDFEDQMRRIVREELAALELIATNPIALNGQKLAEVVSQYQLRQARATGNIFGKHAGGEASVSGVGPISSDEFKNKFGSGVRIRNEVRAERGTPLFGEVPQAPPGAMRRTIRRIVWTVTDNLERFMDWYDGD